MLTIVAFALGFFIGWRRAARRGGVAADKWQYAIAHSLIFGVAAFVLSVVLVNLGVLQGGPVG